MTEPTAFAQYLATLPSERRGEVERVWQLVREHMPAGYTETIGPKFLTFMAGDDWYVALANQKQHMSLYLIPIYVFPDLKAKLDGSGKKLKGGKSCINFKRAAELPLDVIAEIVSAADSETYQARVRAVRQESSRRNKGR